MTGRAGLFAALLGAFVPACSHRAGPPPIAPPIAPRTRAAPPPAEIEYIRSLPIDHAGATYCGPYFGGPYPGVLRILADGEPDDPIARPPPPIGAPPSPEFFELDHWF